MIRSQYYSNKEVLFELVKRMVGREISFLSPSRKFSPVRSMKIHKLAFLNSNFQNFHFFEKDFNIYYSLAKVENMPCFSYFPKKRAEQQEVFKNNFLNYVVGYDLGLDFDGKDSSYVMDVWGITKRIVDVFREHEILFEVSFSGGKGFHIDVPFETLPKMNLSDYPKWCGMFAKKIGMIFNLQSKEKYIDDNNKERLLFTLDMSVYDLRRIWKLPYSLVGENVALPLDYEQFYDFNLDMVKVGNVLKNIKIRDRKTDTLINGKRENLLKFCKEFDIPLVI